MDTEPGHPRRPGDPRHAPPQGEPSPRATPLEGLPVHPATPEPPGARPPPSGAPIPPGAPTRPIVQARPGAPETAGAWGRPPDPATSQPAGTSFPYIDYLLTNPTQDEVLLNFPGDVFLRREFVTSGVRSRCEPKTGVPDDMCTPPTKSEVVRRLAGGELIPAAGGDRYMPPGATYLVRVTVEAPIKRDITSADMGLYVWRQLYMADNPAKQVPFPE
ncbi:hypothetical protein [Actinomadura sp. 3N407]|uniref:hypothetical protein n=1 Tax=Actinomadura sp. 3N407 TaxID=3457423 RepID=UPI003FCE118C